MGMEMVPDDSSAVLPRGDVGLSAEDALQDDGKKRKRKPVTKNLYRFGNYHHYYGYRLGKTLDEDPRLKLFQREWFEEKDCIDIGCNEGFVTISIAQKFFCRSVLGLDIDKVLIEKANCNLQEEAAALEQCEDGCFKEAELGEIRQEDGEAMSMGESTPNLAVSDEYSKVKDKEETPRICECSTPSARERLLQTVQFRSENVIKDFPHGDYMKDGPFDTVLCLSITKWIHLNWGDDGLIRLFAKIYHILRPGGILILEPQPWKSYKKKHHVSEVTRQYFKEILIRPAHFPEILLDKIGFKSFHQVSSAVPNSSIGFDRSLFLYIK